jgi:hypothetical protein
MLPRFTFLAIFIASSAGCVGHFLYESPGSVLTSAGQQTNALLYWYGDDGRLWYGRRYRQIDSGVSMIVCGTPAKSFDGGDEEEPLMIKSRPGDRLVRREDDDGGLVPIADPPVLSPGSGCGQISLSGAGVPSKKLIQGSTPDVSVLCDNPQRPDRYPAAGIYRFESINRTRIKGHVEPGDVCAGQGGTPP